MPRLLVCNRLALNTCSENVIRLYTASPEEGELEVPINNGRFQNDEFQDNLQLKDGAYGHRGRSLYDCNNDTESLQIGGVFYPQ
jgi:hypothetical protein